MITGLGEGVIWLIQSNLLGIDPSSIYIDVNPDDGFWNILGIGGFAAGAFAACFAVATGGAGIIVGAAAAVAGGLAGKVTVGLIEDSFEDDFYLPLYAISPQEIFSGAIPALDVNFINPGSSESLQNSQTEDAQTETDAALSNNTAEILAPQISKWYVALRNLVLVGLMVILLYIGIRIVISSTAGEKAKYKEHIKDWLVAVVLVVFMHYIMAFALTITDYLVRMINSNNQYIEYQFSDSTIQKIEEQTEIDIEGNSYYTNLLGYARLMQQRDMSGDEDRQFTWDYIGYTIIYLVMVIYTVMFLIIYLKRVIYMAFLTVIAPLVALTYPIDKISDGQAQAFNMWLKEYIYNLLLQPFHLLLYTLLVGSAMDLAVNNMIYAIVALGFLIPAERLLRRFFGFDQKAPEAGSIVGGVVGGSMAMNAINSMRRIGSIPKKSIEGSGKNSDGGLDKNSQEKVKIRTADSDHTIDSLMSGFGGEESNQTNASMDNFGNDVRFAGVPRVGPAVVDENGNIPDISSGYTVTKINNLNDNEELNDRSNEKPYINQENPTIIRTQGNIATNKVSNIPVNQDKKKKFISGVKKVGAGVATGLKYTGRGIVATGKGVPRLVTKAALGASLGVAGVAAGVATGDWSNVATYGVAAAGVGASIGEGVSNVAGNATRAVISAPSKLREGYMQGRYSPEERKKLENQKLDKEWEESKDTIRMYKDEFGKDGYKEAMENAKKYREYGITDDKAIIKAQKMSGLKDENKASRERMLYARASSTINSEKDLKDFGDRMKENGVSDTQVKEFKKNLRKMNKM